MNYVIAHALYNSRDPIFNGFNEVTCVEEPDQLRKNHILVLHGGGDISPTLYNQKPIRRCGADTVPSQRDKAEWALLDGAVKKGIPVVGICRGAQMACAYDGGYLIQHINGHTNGSHLIQDKETLELYRSTSAHHQMMVPAVGHKNMIIADSCQAEVMGIDENENDIILPQVPEIVYFPKIRTLGIQGHPEWAQGTPFVAYCTQLIHKYLLGN